jgi:hypothetical protein
VSRDRHVGDDTTDTMGDTPVWGQTLSRRRLFELGGATAALAALLAACGGDDEGDPGRIGYAPAATELPEEEITDEVYLRTLMSLEQSILEMYHRFQSDGELDGKSAAALERFAADHAAASDEYATLIEGAGGTPFPCPNPWYEERFFGPTLDHVFGDPDATPAVPPSDDIPRDVMSLVYALETLVSRSTFQFVGHLTTAELRATTISLGSQAARRAATMALIINPGPAGYVLPELIGDEAAMAAAASATEPAASAPAESQAAGSEPGGSEPGGSEPPAPPALPPTYAITSRFEQLTAVDVTVGAPDELNLRFTTAYQTPADNAYAYTFLECPA